MSKSKRDERLVEMSLATVGEGELEAQFQERAAQAAEVLSDPSRFHGAKAVKVTITCKVEIVRDLELGIFRVSVPGVTLSEPKKSPVVTGAYLRDGSFKVEEPVEQLTILRPQKAGAQGEE